MLAFPALAVGSLLVAALSPQGEAPVVVPLRVELADGTPMPGVPIVVPVPMPVEVAAPGWWRWSWPMPTPPPVRVIGASDPAGIVEVTANAGRLDAMDLQAGVPFARDGLLRRREDWVLRVTRLEPITVRVVDHTGAAVPNLPIGLFATQVPSFTVWTDARGVATFGVPPDRQERFVVRPTAWIGGDAAFPRVSLAERHPRRVGLAVPPHGMVHVRCVAAAAPTRIVCLGAAIDVPCAAAGVPDTLRAQPIAGVEFAMVEVGHALRGHVTLDAGILRWSAPAPKAHREVVAVDLDVDPPRCRIACTLFVRGAPVAPGIVTVRVRTDRSMHRESCNVREDGRVEPPFLSHPIGGERVLRVDVDWVSQSPPRPCAWSVSLPLDRPVVAGTIDLGRVDLVAHPLLLRGRVVAAAGKPVADAEVEVLAVEGGSASPCAVARTRSDGSFVCDGALPRGPDGALLPLAARVRPGGEPRHGLRVGDEVTLVAGAVAAPR